MYCSNCGTKIASEWKFCNSCGKPIEKSFIENPAPVETVSTNPVENNSVKTSSAESNPVKTSPVESNSVRPNPAESNQMRVNPSGPIPVVNNAVVDAKQKKKTKLVIAIVIGAVVLSATLIAVFFILQAKDESKTKDMKKDNDYDHLLDADDTEYTDRDDTKFTDTEVDPEAVEAIRDLFRNNTREKYTDSVAVSPNYEDMGETTAVNDLLDMDEFELYNLMYADVVGFYDKLYFDQIGSYGQSFKEVLYDNNAHIDYMMYDDTVYAYVYWPTDFGESNGEYVGNGYLLAIYETRLEGDVLVAPYDLFSPSLHAMYGPSYYDLKSPYRFYNEYYADVNEDDLFNFYYSVLYSWKSGLDIYEDTITNSGFSRIYTVETRGHDDVKNLRYASVEEAMEYCAGYTEDFFAQLFLNQKNSNGVSMRDFYRDNLGVTWYYAYNEGLASAYGVVEEFGEYTIIQYDVIIRTSEYNLGGEPLWDGNLIWPDSNPKVSHSQELVWYNADGPCDYLDSNYLGNLTAADNNDIAINFLQLWNGVTEAEPVILW